MSLVSSALWKLKLRSCSQLPLKKLKPHVYQSPRWEISPSVPISSTTIFPDAQQLQTSPTTTCPLTTTLQVSFPTLRLLHEMGRNPKQLAESTYISQLAGLSEERKAELLTRNTTRSSCFPPWEESKGNSCERCSPMLWQWKGNPFWCKAKETAGEHTQAPQQKTQLWAFTTKHQISSSLRCVCFPGALENQAAGQFSGTGLISALQIRGTPSQRVRRRLMNDLATLTTTLVSLSEAAS